MSKGFITEKQAEESLWWLIDNSSEIGRAVEEATLTERLVGHVEALQSKAADGSDARRKEAARTSQEYLRAVYAEAKAAGELAKLRSLRDAHGARLEAWRSQSANFRALST